MENFQLSDFLTHYDDYILLYMFSRHAEKYVRRGKLDWPVGATSRESIKAVTKLPRLQVCYFLTCEDINMVYFEFIPYLFPQIFSEPYNAACGSFSW